MHETRSSVDPPFDISDCFVVSDSYDAETTLSLFEGALEEQSPIIVIEPVQLGEETSKWIRVGNCLHKTAVLSALSCTALGTVRSPSCTTSTAVCIGLGAASVVCAAVYAVSWQFDPCCKYQPAAADSEILRCLPLVMMSSTSPVVLVRHDDTRRKWLQNTLAVAATVVCLWRFYAMRR